MSLFKGEVPVLGQELYADTGRWNFNPQRMPGELTKQEYGFSLPAGDWFKGTASGAHSWLLGLTGNRTVASVGADLNDAYMRITGSNYAANQANYVFRGVNCSIVARSPGVIGTMEAATFTADTRSGSTTTTAIGVVAAADCGGAVSGTMLGLDVSLRRQAATEPTTEAGIRIRNRADGNAVDAAIIVRGEDDTIVGFDRFCDMGADQLTLKQTSGKVTLFKINIGGTAYYVRASNSAVTVEANEA